MSAAIKRPCKCHPDVCKQQFGIDMKKFYCRAKIRNSVRIVPSADSSSNSEKSVKIMDCDG